MIGFDSKVARGAARRRTGCLAVLLAAVPCAPFLVRYVLGELARWRVRPFRPGIFVAFALFALLCVVVNAGLAEWCVAKARRLHLYGRRARGRVTRRLGEPLALFGTFWAEVESAGGAGWLERRCRGMPWDVRALRLGEELLLVVPDPPGARRRPPPWLPYWLTPGDRSTDEAARPVLDGLATVLRPVEVDIRRRSRRGLWASTAVALAVSFILTFLVLPLAGDGSASLWQMAVTGYIAGAVGAALAWALTRGKDASLDPVARFDEVFPEGSPLRSAAREALEEELVLTPAWGALRAALARRDKARDAGQ